LDIEESLHVEELLKEKKLSLNHIYRFKNSNGSSKYFKLITSLFVLLNLVVLLNIIKLHKDQNSLEIQKAAFINTHNLPTTSFQIQSIKDELELLGKKQTNFRESIFYVNKFRLLKNEFFSSVYLKNGVLKLSINLKSQKREDIFKKYVSKKLTLFKSKKENKSLIVEIKL
jgi:hypothetical protein